MESQKPIFTNKQHWIFNLNKNIQLYFITYDLLRGKNENTNDLHRLIILSNYSIVLLKNILDEWDYKVEDSEVLAFKVRCKPIFSSIRKFKHIEQIRNEMIAHNRGKKGKESILLSSSTNNIDAPIGFHDFTFTYYLLKVLAGELTRVFGKEYDRAKVSSENVKLPILNERFTSIRDIEVELNNVLTQCGIKGTIRLT